MKTPKLFVLFKLVYSYFSIIFLLVVFIILLLYKFDLFSMYKALTSFIYSMLS